MDADLHFYFEPTCPVSWLASTWIRREAAARGQSIDWRFLSLRVLNTGANYDTAFAPGLEHVHNAGLRMLRVAAHARAEKGREAVDRFQRACGEHIFETAHANVGVLNAALDARLEHVEAILDRAGLPKFYAELLNDPSREEDVVAETFAAMELTGKGVGAPVVHLTGAGGGAFAGPVLARTPATADAVALTDTFLTEAGFPGFAEFRSGAPDR